eukprot:TRINITY_DN29689_c0_g1_i1.p1 TRINITY_DN29689_c0_g1~~TRINITY_DN29689_c0_g1_i1.p1  ORF type:complete len:350 (+),score=50.46 TRINITY_DN29689_c0_g1_i1:76-1050(+)
MHALPALVSLLATSGAGRQGAALQSAAPPDATGGATQDSEDPNDWQPRYGYGPNDTYPAGAGCLSTATGIDVALAQPNIASPFCETTFEKCKEEAAADPLTKLKELCKCLLHYKQCISQTLATLNANAPQGLSTQGCPPIVLSRICSTKEQAVSADLSFDEGTLWSCAACSGADGEEPGSCIDNLASCTCHTAACEDGATGCKCQSMACLVQLLRCWVYEQGCSSLSAWYLCLYDTAALVGEEDNGTTKYGDGDRDLRCSVATCREAITHLKFDDNLAYLYVSVYVCVLVLGLGAVLYVRWTNRRFRLRRLAELRLAPDAAKGD